MLYIINNAKGVFVEPISDIPTEKELLLKSGTKFVIDSIDLKEGVYLVSMTQND